MSNTTEKTSDEKIIDLDPDQVVDVDSTANASEPPKPAPRGRSNLPLLGLAAVLVGAVGGGWLYRDYLSSYFPSNELARVVSRTEAFESENTALRNQVGQLENITSQFKTDIDALESSIGATHSDAKSAAQAVAALSQRADKIEKTIAELRTAQDALSSFVSGMQSTPATAAAPVDLTAVTERLTSLEKDVASLKVGQGDTKDLSLLSQALSNLKAQFATGAPFAGELDRIKQMAPAAPGLEDLARYGASGLPTAPALAAELTAIAAQLKPASTQQASPTDDSWSGWIADMFSDIVTIRNAGDADWVKTSEAAAAFADSGDLPQAIAHVLAAEGSKPPQLQQWLERAQARVASEDTLRGIEAAVLRVLAAQ
jgi:hypothetical protein